MIKIFKKKIKHDLLISKFKLIVLPLIIMLMPIVIISLVGLYYNRTIMLNQLKTHSINYAKQTVIYVDEFIKKREITLDNLEDRLTFAANQIFDDKTQLDNNYLKNIAINMNIDCIYYYSPQGKIMHSTKVEFVGFQAHEGDTIYEFMNSDLTIFHDEIKLVSESDIYYKFSYFKDLDGNFVQLGFLADSILELTDVYDFQNIVTNIASNKDIMYALIIDNNLTAIADSDVEDIGINYSGDNEYLKALSGESSTVEWYYERVNKNVLEVSVPLIINDNIEGVLAIGYSMDSVDIINLITFIALISLSLLIGIIALITQWKYLIKPLFRLNDDIQRIDYEVGKDYKLPIVKNNSFNGVYLVINRVLKKINAYINKINDLNLKLGMVVQDTETYIFEISLKENSIYFPFGFDKRVFVLSKKKYNLDEFLHQYIGDTITNKLKLAYNDVILNKRKKFEYELNVKDIFGKNVYYLIIAKEYNDGSTVSGNVINITNIKEQKDNVEYLAYHDVLTSLPNRRLLMNHLSNINLSKEIGALIIIDINQLKEINDTLGHMYGDEILKIVAKRLNKFKNNQVFVSRFGGDEFVICVLGDKYSVDNVCLNMLYSIKEPLGVNEYTFELDCCIGIALFPKDGTDSSELISKADIAMFHVKANNAHGYSYFESSMQDHIMLNNRIHMDLKQAVKENGFKLLYQPIVEAKTGNIHSYEALLRINNSNVTPDKFIKIAEEKGLISEIGRWVVNKVINQIIDWQIRKIEIKPISINLSPLQMKDKFFVKYLEKLLIDNNIDPQYIEVEITENVFINENDNTLEFLNELRNIGIKVSLDDFGSGYSSLNYLTFIPIDKIKLDKSINDKYLNDEHKNIIKHIINLAHDLNLKIVAEGIETNQQLQILLDLKCDYIQGYLFSKPEEIEKIESIKQISIEVKI